MHRVVYTFIALFILFNTGCASIYNHNRVKSKMIETRIKLFGTENQKRLVACDISPNTILKIEPTDENGIQLGLNLFGLQSYFTTFKEAPVSSTLSLVFDAAVAYIAAEVIEDETSNNDDNDSTVTTYNTTQDYPGNVTIININSPVSGNVEVQTTDGDRNIVR